MLDQRWIICHRLYTSSLPILYIIFKLSCFCLCLCLTDCPFTHLSLVARNASVPTERLDAVRKLAASLHCPMLFAEDQVCITFCHHNGGTRANQILTLQKLEETHFCIFVFLTKMHKTIISYNSMRYETDH